MGSVPTFERLPMPVSYFRLILRCFGTTPERHAAIIAGTGVNKAVLRDPATEITLHQQLRQIRNVVALVGEDWPLVPALRTIQMHGAIGIAALSAPDIGAAMAVLGQLAAVHAPFSRLSLHRHVHTIELEFRVDAGLEVAQWRPLVEVAFLGLGEIIAALLGRPAAEARFSFACPPPPHAERMRAALNGRVGYDAAVNTVTIPIDWEDIPSPFADPILFAQTSAALQVALQRLTAPVTIRGRVETLLAAMPDGRLGSAAAAKRLGISQRTMVRRLGEAGTTYRALLDDEIRQRASRLLATGGLSHSEIAVQLGYEDATSFSRAYRRWFNQ